MKFPASELAGSVWMRVRLYGTAACMGNKLHAIIPLLVLLHTTKTANIGHCRVTHFPVTTHRLVVFLDFTYCKAYPFGVPHLWDCREKYFHGLFC